MITTDRWTGLFFILFSLYVCFESWRLGVGSFFRPGAGFFPFYSGALLGVLSVILGFLAFRGKVGKAESWTDVGNTVTVSLAVLGFALLLTWLGFVITTFLFILFLLRAVERRAWLLSASAALFISAAFYVVFGLWLKAQLPAGILGR
ncbi:MAG: tripartite tricarboxylate transporter TctB family protein [Deltaproteobacteria bacterium]|nr:tripartite tricarboxylate transporter TctB family protein [Deltaproteobacteria bacterium]MDZ4342446.1 tripartite tricarboxylate transporter TctB family protein [Candidatus Binatia bacterium]